MFWGLKSVVSHFFCALDSATPLKRGTISFPPTLKGIRQQPVHYSLRKTPPPSEVILRNPPISIAFNLVALLPCLRPHKPLLPFYFILKMPAWYCVSPSLLWSTHWNLLIHFTEILWVWPAQLWTSWLMRWVWSDSAWWGVQACTTYRYLRPPDLPNSKHSSWGLRRSGW